MGNCLKVLYETELEQRSVTPSSMWGDLCENIHIHIRNLRLDLSKEEFDNLYNAATILKDGLKKAIEEYDWKPGNEKFLISFDNGVRLTNDSAYFPNRLKVELERKGRVHIHYREVRLHLMIDEMKELAKALNESIKNLEGTNE